jgi:uncharacterized protein (DUF1778 family)
MALQRANLPGKGLNVPTPRDAKRSVQARQKKQGATRSSLNMRVRSETRDLLDSAARISGKNLTDFVLEAARQAAQQTLLDRTAIVLDPASYELFLAQLDAPPRPRAALRKSLMTQAPWE